MDNYRFRVQLLDTLVEDYTSLVEVRAEFAAQFPLEPEEGHLRRARAFVRELVRDGYAHVFERDVHLDGRAGRRYLTQVQPERVDAILTEDSNWSSSAARPTEVVVATTSEGERALATGKFSQ